MAQYINIEIAVNDDQGNTSDKVYQVVISNCQELLLQFETVTMGGHSFSHLHNKHVEQTLSGREQLYFAIDGKSYAVHSYSKWTGNIFWNTYQVAPAVAAQLIRDLHSSDTWIIAEGLSSIIQALNSGDFNIDILQSTINETVFD